MKLNKEVCKACYKKYRKKSVARWTSDDEKRWKKGHLVICPVAVKGFMLYDTDIDIGPEYFTCPYHMEHLVLSDKDSSKC